MEIGGLAPAMMNAANEVAVQAFLDGQTNFYGITDCIENVIGRVSERSTPAARPALEDIFAADAEARQLAREYLNIHTATS
jgi:1-deoxy-D-xylulose-5-phosphate reductoisomerase